MVTNGLAPTPQFHEVDILQITAAPFVIYRPVKYKTEERLEAPAETGAFPSNSHFILSRHYRQ